MEAKGDWDFRSLIWSKTLIELILNPVVDFSEVRRAQLAIFTVLTSTLVPLGSLKVCSDAKESGVRKATGRYCTYSIPGKTAALVPEFYGGRPAFSGTAA